MTTMNASSEAIKTVFETDLIIINEDARATEPSHWFLLGNYINYDLLLIRDEAQLKPVILSDRNSNGMVAQLGLSLCSRLRSIDHGSSILLNQHRQVPMGKPRHHQEYHLVSGESALLLLLTYE